jgi:protein PhnA
VFSSSGLAARDVWPRKIDRRRLFLKKCHFKETRDIAVVMQGHGTGPARNRPQGKQMTDEFVVKDSNGAQLVDWDAVTLIKNLKVKGTSETLKRGTLVKNIRLTANVDEIEAARNR